MKYNLNNNERKKLYLEARDAGYDSEAAIRYVDLRMAKRRKPEPKKQERTPIILFRLKSDRFSS